MAKLASEFIEELNALINEHGDLPVVDENNDPVDAEFNDDDEDDVVFVIG